MTPAERHNRAAKAMLDEAMRASDDAEAAMIVLESVALGIMLSAVLRWKERPCTISAMAELAMQRATERLAIALNSKEAKR